MPHDACPDCGGALTDAGSTSSKMLDWSPAQLRVVRATRPKCACRACGTLLQAPAPERVLAGGLATPGLIAHVMAGVRVFADDTTLPVLDPGRSKTKTGRLGAEQPKTLWGWAAAGRRLRSVPPYLGDLSAAIPATASQEPWAASLNAAH